MGAAFQGGAAFFMKVLFHFRLILCLSVFAVLFGMEAFAQSPQAVPPTAAKPKTERPVVTKVDEVSVKELFLPKAKDAKPLLVNFWATWCVPCVEEFPDLVKLDEEYRGKIELITISLDDLAEINRDVPNFLTEMNAKMPAYLLHTLKENEVIGAISKDWSGALPFTVLYDEKRDVVFIKQGKIELGFVKNEIEKLIGSKSAVTETSITELPTLPQKVYSFEQGVEEAKKDVSAGIFKVKYYGLVPMMEQSKTDELKRLYGIDVLYNGCIVSPGMVDYGKGYNEISVAAIKEKFGDKVWQ